MPADNAMGFGIDSLRCCVEVSRRSRVSDIVEEEDWERRWTRASIAAIGIVISGSSWRMFR